MENQKLNIFIVDDNKLMDITLKQYLKGKFGENINISIFYDGESCLEKIGQNTNIVILDYFLECGNKNSKNGLETLEEIKKINPKTEVFMFTSCEDTAEAIKAFDAGASGYVVKGYKSWDNLTTLIKKVITKPVSA